MQYFSYAYKLLCYIWNGHVMYVRLACRYALCYVLLLGNISMYVYKQNARY